MSGFVVEPEDMNYAAMIDEKLDALLAGRAEVGDRLAAELSLILEQIGEAFPAPVISEEVEEAHVAKIMHATAAPAPATAPRRGIRPQMFTGIRAVASRRIAAATLAVSTAFGGAAYAGVLPAPVQRAVANGAAIIGLQLPNPDHDGAERRPRGGAAGDGRDHAGQSTNSPESDYRRTRDKARRGVDGELGDGRSGSGAGSLDHEPRDGRDGREREWGDDGDDRDDDGHRRGKSNDDDDGESDDIGDGDEPDDEDDAAPDEDDMDGEDEAEDSSRSDADGVDDEEPGDE